MKLMFSFFLFLPLFNVYSATMYQCKEVASTSITWNEFPSILERKGLVVSAKDSVTKPVQISLYHQDKVASLKGNGDTINLTVIDSETFVEYTPGRNSILWRVLKTPNKKTYIFSMKAYESGGPVSYTSAYECN